MRFFTSALPQQFFNRFNYSATFSLLHVRHRNCSTFGSKFSYNMRTGRTILAPLDTNDLIRAKVADIRFSDLTGGRVEARIPLVFYSITKQNGTNLNRFNCSSLKCKLSARRSNFFNIHLFFPSRLVKRVQIHQSSRMELNSELDLNNSIY